MRRTLPHRDLNRHWIGTEPWTDLFEHTIKISPFSIELVDKHDPWNAILVGLPPDRFALGFNTFACTEDDDSSVEDSQAPFDFGSEIDVAWGIEQIDGTFFPTKRHARSEDRNTSLLFLGIIIGLGRPRIDSPCAVFGPAHVEHLFGDGRFTGIDMGDDSDVSDRFKLASHVSKRSRVPLRVGVESIEKSRPVLLARGFS
jgi:hypothetical protein